MKIEELITLAENRLMALNNAALTARQTGNTDELARIENDVLETQHILDKLRGVS